MLRRLYDWCIAAADKPHATWLLGVVSFVESSFFPVPPDAMLIPMAIARPDKAWFYATVCTITSVAGGVLGYLIGALLYNSVGLWLVQLYGYGTKVEAFREAYAQWGGWIILLKGLTPIPYKIVTIASGFAGYNLLLFILLSIVARGMRFYLAAFLLNRYGAQARTIIEERLGFWVTVGCRGPGRRHYRRPVSSLEVPSFLIFAMPPAQAAVGCDVGGSGMTSRPGTIGMRGSATAARAAVGTCALLVVFSALAQEAQSPNRAPGPEFTSCRKSERSGSFSPVAAVAATAEPR